MQMRQTLFAVMVQLLLGLLQLAAANPTVEPSNATSGLSILTTVQSNPTAAAEKSALVGQQTSSSTEQYAHVTKQAALATEPSGTTGDTAPTEAAEATSPTCPVGCECEHPEVHCSRAGLSGFPTGLDSNITYLDVGHNQLTAIVDDELASLGYTELTSLICDDNAIETVELHAFRGLHALALVQLSGNRITTLHQRLFSHNMALRHVDLTGNPLQLTANGPILTAQQLEWLDLDRCNLTELSREAFRDLIGLRYLNLSGNRLRSLRLRHLFGLSYLRYLKLADNQLVCDCTVKPLWRWLRQQNVAVVAKCSMPGNRPSQPWNYLELVNCPTIYRSSST